MSPGASRTRTAPALPPDGFWLEHPNYRRYVLFAASGLVLSAVCIEILTVLRALGAGAAAWQSCLELLASPPALLLNVLLLLGTVLYSIRWLRVGTKIPLVRIGPLPAPPLAAIYVAHFAGLVVVSLLVVVVLSGAIL
ncbi:MAG: hypothetical protein ACE5FG_13110 [Myxococcota bacterium]